MIFLDIQKDVFRRLNKPHPPDPQTEERIKGFINDRHRQLMTSPGIDQLRQDTMEVSNFDFPDFFQFIPLAQPPVDRVDSLVDQQTNLRLTEKPLTWLRTVDPRYSSGTPTVYIHRGYQHEHFRSSIPGGLFVETTAPADVSTVIRVEGFVMGLPAFPYRHLTTATGSIAFGRTQVGTLDQWVEVTKVFLSAPAVGIVMVYIASAGQDRGVAVVPPGQFRSYFSVLQLWPMPTGLRTYLLDYTRSLTEMVEDTDEPMLPRDFHDLLATGARIDEYEKTSDNRIGIAQREWDQRFKDLNYFLHGRSSERVIPRGMKGRVGVNNLGGNFPADYWI